MRKLNENELRTIAKTFEMILNRYYLEGKSVMVKGSTSFLDLGAEKKNFKAYLDVVGDWKPLYNAAYLEGLEFNEKVYNSLFETWWEKGLFN